MPPKKQQLPPVPASTAVADGALPKKETPAAVKYYLVAYNAISALSWAYILISLTLHLLGLGFSFSPSSSPATIATRASASTRLTSWFSPLSKAASAKAKSGTAARVSEKFLQPLLQRASTSYAAVGPETTLVQTLALLEVLHAALGWVRSPVQTTAAQVASRIFLTWGVTERFESARTSPIYASMVLAWSLTEVIRYSFYAVSLLRPSVPYPLLWLRYTTFLVLYPIGASSEAFVNFATLPRSTPIPTSSYSAWLKGNLWGPYDYVRGILFLVWWPGLYFMYTYMLGQRKKVLGTGFGFKLGEKPKRL